VFYAEHYDMNFDGGVVDAFLNVQDRAYTVPQLFDFIGRAGLKFQAWLDNGVYAFDRYFRPDHPLRARALALPLVDRCAVIEALTQKIDRHSVFCCLPSKSVIEPTADIGFSIPILRPGVTVEAGKNEAGRPVSTLRRSDQVVRLTPEQSLFVGLTDGKRSVSDIVRQLLSVAPDEAALMNFATGLVTSLHDQGHVILAV